jgi:predicted DNA-binding protein (UPF0278 family)
MPRRPSEPHVKTSLYIPAAIFKELEELSSRTDVPKSRLIRRGIVLVIKEFKQKKRFEPQQAEGPG